MAGAAIVFLSQKPGTKDGIILPTISFLVWGTRAEDLSTEELHQAFKLFGNKYEITKSDFGVHPLLRAPPCLPR